jgi:hypothetical protein
MFPSLLFAFLLPVPSYPAIVSLHHSAHIVAFSPLALFQGSRTHIIAPSVHAWRKTVMAVRRSSTLVPAEQICSMRGVVSVSLCPCPWLVNICLTVFQASRRVNVRHIFPYEILLDYLHPYEACPGRNGGYKWTTTDIVVANKESKSREWR